MAIWQLRQQVFLSLGSLFHLETKSDTLQSSTLPAVLIQPRLAVFPSSLRSMSRVVSVTLVSAATTPWSGATPWAACRVPVTLEAPCLGGAATSAPDSVRVERAWRACSAPPVPTTTTTTAVRSSRVRGCCERRQQWTASPLCDVREQLGARILFHLLVDSTCAQSDEWSQGCAPCTCDPRGTVPGSVCDSTTGQCVCLPTRHGRDCSHCRPGEAL